MSDLYHYLGSDLSLSATGDLQSVDGTEMGQQRVLRRLLSNSAIPDQQIAADYIWHEDYGASLPREVGNLNDPARIEAEIRASMFLESCVARSPDPVITVTPIAQGISVQIQYADAVTGDLLPLAFDINT